MISIIAAVDRHMAIGYENKLLFWLPNDLKRFKALTTGNTIIMGRKTFDQLERKAERVMKHILKQEQTDIFLDMKQQMRNITGNSILKKCPFLIEKIV